MKRGEIESPWQREQALLVELVRLHAEAAPTPPSALLTVLEQAATPLVLTDPNQPDHPITFANRAFQELTGYSAAELLGRNCRMLQAPETDPAARGRIRGALAAGQEVAVELVNRRRDGSRFRNALLITPVRDRHGRLLSHLGTPRALAVDTPVTAGPAPPAGEALWRSVFAWLQEALLLGEALRDPAGQVVEARCLDVNPAWCAMTGLPAGTARGAPLRQLFPGADAARIGQVARLLDGDAGVVPPWQVDRPGRCYEGRLQRLEGDRFVILFTEVTAAREAERRRAALAELDAGLGEGGAPAEMARIGATILGRTLRADRAGYGTITAEGASFTLGEDWTAPGLASLAGDYPMCIFGDYGPVLLQGEAVVVEDVGADPRTASIAAMLQGAGIHALINLPVMEGGRLVAVLFVNQAAPRAWTAEEVAFAGELAQRLRQAVERRRAEAELRTLAASLEQQVAERAQALAEARAFSRLALAAVRGIGVWSFDVASGRFTADAAIADLYGFDPAELAAGIGREQVLAQVHPEDRERLQAVMQSGLHHQGDQELEYRILHRNGRVRWMLSRGHTHFAADGRPVRRLGVGVETTRQRELEEQLRQSQKMEAVGQLTGGVAHDFNNLLTGIIGSLELLTRRLAQGQYAEIPRYAEAARGAAQRAAALTHRLLAFSRRQTLDPRPTDANRLVAGMEEMIRRSVGPSIALVLVAEPALWTVLVDPPQLENALLNLCINARDAMPSGGRLEIATLNRRLDAAEAAAGGLPPGDYVTLCVSDSGSGMTPEVIARAFEPFFTTKPQGQGTGLGLSMIYGFVRQSGGTVRIASTPGEGSCICLDLPRHAGPALPPPPSGEATMPQGGGERVLVVDDEPSVRLMVAEVLEELGYAALEAADGPAGLRILQSAAPLDLLVTDVGLPGGMNGRQLAEAAQRLRPGLRILFITGFAESAVLSHGDLGPGMQLLTKPFSLEALAQRLRGLIAAD
ncbi:PAS domain-containing protein [Roseomonas sp. USHLN139]|uniref:PAS domain-containing protein n=1 Tax=Roseomonas sp. USHLN139 TaxID=3081298 RepID=UPI003B01D5C5